MMNDTGAWGTMGAAKQRYLRSGCAMSRKSNMTVFLNKYQYCNDISWLSIGAFTTYLIIIIYCFFLLLYSAFHMYSHRQYNILCKPSSEITNQTEAGLTDLQTCYNSKKINTTRVMGVYMQLIQTRGA